LSEAAISGIAIVLNTLVATPRESLLGLGFIALGIPVYFLQGAWRKARRQA
jgi:hypothetical protein